MKTLILTLAALLVAASAMAQGSYTAATCNQTDVNAVINGPTHTAVAGDTINIPSTGSPCTWTSSSGTTGSGNQVLSTSPTITTPVLVTPNLGTPSAGVLTNATALPLQTGTLSLFSCDMKIGDASGSALSSGSYTCQVWVKPLNGTNTCAIAMFNLDTAGAHNITATFSTIAAAYPQCGSGPYTTTSNLWANWPSCGGATSCAASLGTLTGSYTATSVPAYGSFMMTVAP
jgi:hypothetical protein